MKNRIVLLVFSLLSSVLHLHACSRPTLDLKITVPGDKSIAYRESDSESEDYAGSIKRESDSGYAFLMNAMKPLSLQPKKPSGIRRFGPKAIKTASQAVQAKIFQYYPKSNRK